MWNGARRKKRGTSGATPSGRGRRPGTALPPVCSLQRRTGGAGTEKGHPQVGQGGGQTGRCESRCPFETAWEGTRQSLIPAGPGTEIHHPRRGEQGGGRELRRPGRPPGGAADRESRGLWRPPLPPGAGRPQAETLAGCIKSGAGGGESQCGFLLAEIRHGEPPACVQQSHLPAVAEEAPAKAVRRCPPGRDRRGPGRGQGVPDRRLRSEERRRDHRPEAGRLRYQKQAHPPHRGRDWADPHAHHGADAVLHLHVRGGLPAWWPPPIFRRTQT